ncbi:GNAT N-acetyltransferase [Seiridium cupressi]
MTITVSTTLPRVEDSTILPFETERLVIRPLLYPGDLPAYRTIRSQPAAMTSSRTGLPDFTVEQTEAKLKRLQPPYHGSHVYFGIFLKSSVEGSEGELIGDGGVHEFAHTETGWPEFGYKFKEEHWGRGYATEFARAFMQFWWALPRVGAQVDVALSSVGVLGKETSNPSAGGHTTCWAREQVCAWTKIDNKASQRVLQKVGFEAYDGLSNGLVNWRYTRPD